MKNRFVVVLLLYAIIFHGSAFGFSTHSINITRNIDKYEITSGLPITIKVQIFHSEEDDIRGFYYTEQTPEGFQVETKSIKIDDSEIVNYKFETGLNGEIYSGYYPCRWIIEIPPDLFESNPVSFNEKIEIIFSISYDFSGVFDFGEYSWIGYFTQESSSAFGYSEEIDKKTIVYIDSCEADFDKDGTVEESDIAIFAENFGKTQCNQSTECAMGLFGNDGDIDGSDLAIFVSLFGHDCPNNVLNINE